MSTHHRVTYLFSVFSRTSKPFFFVGTTLRNKNSSCALGVVSYMLLSGSVATFRRIGPSNYTRLGSFSRKSLPATERYATPNQRTILEQWGHDFGCHTCGSRQRQHQHLAVKFVGDHMPPKSVAKRWNDHWLRRRLFLFKRPVQFRFYPQCVSCSNRQGSILSAAMRRRSPISGAANSLIRKGANSRSSAYYFHGWRPRLYHGTGGVLAGKAMLEHRSKGRRGRP